MTPALPLTTGKLPLRPGTKVSVEMGGTLSPAKVIAAQAVEGVIMNYSVEFPGGVRLWVPSHKLRRRLT